MNSTLNSQIAVEPGSWNAWLVALRPKTLWIAVVPVFVGTSLAVAETGQVNPLIAFLALVASILLQILTNLQNDVGYTKRGAETASRIGLPRATARGWLTVAAVHRALIAVVIATVLVGLPIVLHGGWPVLAMGVASILAAWAYMGGPRPIAYTPYGELVVFVFFGLVAVGGTWYVQAGLLGLAPLIAGAAIGMHAAAVLLVNNFRDRAHDATTGRRTLAVALGREGSLRLYAALLLAPFGLAALLAWLAATAWLALPLAALPWAFGLIRALVRAGSGLALNTMLFRTVLLEVAYGMLLSAGALAHGVA